MQNMMIAIRVVLCGWLAFLCSFIDRLIWPPVIPIAAKELGLTAAQAGGFMSAFFFGYLLTQLPGGLLSDRIGTRRVLLVSLLLMGVFTTATGWVSDFWPGAALRFLAGVGSGAVLSASVKGVYDNFEAKYRATAMGFFMTSAPLGLLVANILSPMIAANFGWRSAFLIAGGITLFVFGLSWLILPSQTRNVAAAARTDSSMSVLRTLVVNRNLMLTAAAGFFAMWGTWGVLTWTNSYIQQGLGLTLKQSGQVMVLFGLGALVGQPVAGWISDQFWRYRRQVSMLILLFFSVLIWLFANNRDIGSLHLLAPLLGAGSFIFGPVLNTFISELVEARSVATAIGMCNAIWQIGSLISPITAGVILDNTGSYLWAFTVLAAGPMLAVALLAFVRMR